MSRARTARHRELAADVWRRLFDFLIATSGQRQRVLAELDLTPNDSRALHTLDPAEGRTMRSLADAWGCDASNATWIVDRLEARGLAERRAKPSDRRVKLVVLTPEGLRTRQRLQEGMYEPPPALLELSVAELRALRSATAPLRSDSVEL
jgi:DNA-binding MarR family transcriptional regulator